MKSSKKIIKKIKAGDKSAFNNLLSLHSRMIYSIINSYNRENGDFKISEDDLYQEGSIGLYEAIFTYDENMNVKFSSYAYNIIRNRILNEIRYQSRIYDKERFSLDNYDFSKGNLSYLASDNTSSYYKDCTYDTVLDNVMSNMSNEDRMIVKMRRENISYKQISDALSITTKRIDNRISLIKRKCKMALKELKD